MKLPRASAIILLVLSSILAWATPTRAETGYEGWLRYAAIEGASLRKSYEKTLPAVVVTLGNSGVEQSAQAELIRGVRGMLEPDRENRNRVAGGKCHSARHD